jgi:hypothetical protein
VRHKADTILVLKRVAVWGQIPLRKKNLNIFPIGSYVKTMSADGGHLGWRSGSLDIFLKVDHLRTIHAMLLAEILKIFLSETTKPIEL